MKIVKLLYLIPFILLCSCGTHKAPYYDLQNTQWENRAHDSSKDLVHSLYLVGDAGKLDNKEKGTNRVLQSLQKELSSEEKPATLVYLGDNIYDLGMPKPDSPERAYSEKILNAQLELARYNNGNTYFIPGNHDWKRGRRGGRKYMLEQEEYINEYFEEDFPKKVKMYPENACGDPKVIKIHKDLVFVFIDSQWWLQNWNHEKKMNHKCEYKTRGDFMDRMEEIFLDHKNDEVVLFMHHPLYSNGHHGGNFSWKDHIFPIHSKKIWLPLPVIGSVYPIFRNITGSHQEINNPRYQSLVVGLEKIIRRTGVDCIVASGHEHCLQYFRKNNIKAVVSGSGAKTSYAQAGGDAQYVSESRGYAKILFYEDFETWLEYYAVKENFTTPVLEYRVQLRKFRAGTENDNLEYPPITNPDTTVAANTAFKARPFKTWLMGDQYRNMWAEPVKAKKADLLVEKDGLTPIKKGGGMASNSLRMETKDEKQYILRSINKDYRKLVPPEFANLKILNILKDQNSASHPYGALIIPTLSQAAGVYYTDPKLRYLQHQKGLGNYNQLFPEGLYLLEQRPNGDWSDTDLFGSSADIIGYTDLLEKLREKKKHFIDQEWVLKSRLFDLWIHDWDRHDDQWRWASFKDENRTLYRPIPRDRDQAFYRFKGVVPTLIAALGMRKFKTMKEDVNDVKYLAFNARYFDRFFLNQLEWSDWEKQIQDLQSKMTDDVIVKAVEKTPLEVHQFNNEELIGLLKARRTNMNRIGLKLYNFLSEEIEVAATDNKDVFKIEYLEDGNIRVRQWVDSKKDGLILHYDRTIMEDETDEVRLFGLRGKDEFQISGEDKSKIKLRIIGGPDKDEIVNNSKNKNIYIYDDKDGLKLEGEPVKDKTANLIGINDYDRYGFRYTQRIILPRFGYTLDDKFWVGGNIQWTRHRWRKNPFKAQHNIKLFIAPFSREAYTLDYEGTYPGLTDFLDFAHIANIHYASYQNFFGYGNETKVERSGLRYNWVRMRQFGYFPHLKYHLSNRRVFLSFGPTFESVRIVDNDDRVAGDPDIGFSEEELERKFFIGAKVSGDLGFVDRKNKPTNGLKLNFMVNHQKELDSSDKIWEFRTDMTTYLMISRKPEMVLANRIGFARTDGDAQFYQLQNLGNLTNLRGFRNNRFLGNSAIYDNIDLRIRLTQWNNNVLPMDIGILGGFDIGRVWLDGEDSNSWHRSYTAGIWMDILGVFIVHPYFSITEDGERNTFNLRTSFSF